MVNGEHDHSDPWAFRYSGFPPTWLSHRAGLIRKRTRVSAGRLLSTGLRQSRKQSVPMSFEPAGFAREINRAPRQGKRPVLRVYSRLLPESWLLLGDVQRKREKDKERKTESKRGRVSATMVTLQQCGDSMHRDSNWLPDSDSFSRPLHHDRLLYAHWAGSNKKCLRFSDISTFAWRAWSRRISLFGCSSFCYDSFATDNINIIFHRCFLSYFLRLGP